MQRRRPPIARSAGVVVVASVAADPAGTAGPPEGSYFVESAGAGKRNRSASGKRLAHASSLWTALGS